MTDEGGFVGAEIWRGILRVLLVTLLLLLVNSMGRVVGIFEVLGSYPAF